MIVALLLAAAAAQAAPMTMPMPAPAAAATAPATTATAARLNLDTPIETIVADAKGKAVLEADVPGVTTHPSYEMFKGMSLNQLQSYAADKLTAPVLAKAAADLAAIH